MTHPHPYYWRKISNTINILWETVICLHKFTGCNLLSLFKTILLLTSDSQRHLLAHGLPSGVGSQTGVSSALPPGYFLKNQTVTAYDHSVGHILADEVSLEIKFMGLVIFPPLRPQTITWPLQRLANLYNVCR